MQQNRGVGGGRSDQEMKQNQEDRRLKLTGDNQQPPAQQQQHQQQPPQKCPRCESVNTKFCYYNNYSLSQPRYFCKACRRYWTQGGTLRSVPVGGGCRKGKRTKTSSSGENSRSSQPQVQKLSAAQTITSSKPIIGISSGLDSSPVISSMGSYYHHHPGAGFLSSLATIQSMNQPQPFNQPLNLGGELGGSSNLSLLQGFGFPTFGSQQHQPIQQSHFLELGNREKTVNMYPSAASGPSSQQNWHQPPGFISGNNPTVSEAALWSINDSSTSAATNTATINATVASLNPNQWPDLRGYGPPP